MRARLLSLLRKQQNKKSLEEDRAILMACIGIALVFWLLVKLSQSYTTARPVVFRFAIPSEKALSEAPPADMNAEVAGKGWDLLFGYFNNRKLTLFYDLRSTDRLEINRNDLRMDIARQLSGRDIKVEGVNYDRLVFVLEEKVTRKVPIRLQSRLSFAQEYQQQGKPELNPDSVAVTGPASKVREIDFWETDSLILSDLRQKITRDIPLTPPPPALRLNLSQTRVKIEVEQFTEKSLFVPLTLENAPPKDSIRFFPLRVNITFVVGLSRYNEVTAEDFKLVADLRGLSFEQNRDRVTIELRQKPAFIKNVRLTPKQAEFFLVKRGT